jgi:hypothetical protein
MDGVNEICSRHQRSIGVLPGCDATLDVTGGRETSSLRRLDRHRRSELVLSSASVSFNWVTMAKWFSPWTRAVHLVGQAQISWKRRHRFQFWPIVGDVAAAICAFGTSENVRLAARPNRGHFPQ